MHEFLARPLSLLDYGGALKDAMIMLSLCSLRVFAALFILPPTNDQSLQGVLRNGLCLTLGMFVAWGQPLSLVHEVSVTHLTLLLAKEVMVGVLLGFAVAVVFWVAEGVGAMVDNQAGYNNVQQTNPMSGEQSTPVSNLLSQLAICGFYVLGGLIVMVGLLFESFRWWPLDALVPTWSSALEDFVRTQTSRYLTAVVQVAAPVVLVLVLIDLGFGIVAKTADKLEPNNLAQPVKGAVTIAMLSLLVALFFEQAAPMLSLHGMAVELARWFRH